MTNAPVSTERLRAMIEQASAALAKATTAAEVLDAQREANIVYDAAKIAAKFAKVKTAHDTIIAACHTAQKDALVIEARTQCRLADEYDAAQQRGEVQKPGGDRTSSIVRKENNAPTVTDVGLTRKQVHEARAVRDAENARPGLVEKTLEKKLQAGEEPTRADVRRAVREVAAKKRQHQQQHQQERPRRQTTDPAKGQHVAKKVLDEGKTLDEAASELGTSVQVAKTEVAKEQGRREAAGEVDPSTLAMSAREKLEAAVRQHKRKLDAEFEQRVQDEYQRLLNRFLPEFDDRLREAEATIRARKGIMPRAAYRKILACLHPDRVEDEGLKRRYSEAFNTFTSFERLLIKEDEAPTPKLNFPRTYEEMMALKRKVSEDRKAKRAKGGGQLRQ